LSTVEQPLNKIAATLVDLQERYAKALEVVEAARLFEYAPGSESRRQTLRVALAAFDAASSSLAEGEQDA
jgi:energy-coupling factor transporter ATP-binding protein EcfA2